MNGTRSLRDGGQCELGVGLVGVRLRQNWSKIETRLRRDWSEIGARWAQDGREMGGGHSSGRVDGVIYAEGLPADETSVTSVTSVASVTSDC